MGDDESVPLRDLLSDKDSLLTVREVAHVLRVKETTVREWLRKGVLKGYRIPGGWRVRVANLLDFMEGERQE
jgi:excisionase family DNA binding protein